MKENCKIPNCYNRLSFDEFCNVESIKYWRQNLNGANTKNVKNESQLGGTKKAYTYGLLSFNNWLCNKRFRYTVMLHIGQNTIRCCNKTVRLEGVDHLLQLSMNAYRKLDFVRLIKSYLSEIASAESPSTVKNSMYSIRSFFRENESDVVFHFNHRVRRTIGSHQTSFLTLDNLHGILTTKDIQPIERAVFLCKFQRGLDSSTLVDRFNFDVWEQLVKHFQSTDPKFWNMMDVPVSIQTVRVKTGFLHTGFLDADAVNAIVQYLDVRGDMPESGQPLFVNLDKKPITVNWISRRFHKLVAKARLLHTINGRVANQCASHEMRDLLKSTLIDSGCRPDVADHVIGHVPRDSYEKQAFLYPESLIHEFAKASKRINVLSGHTCKHNIKQNKIKPLENTDIYKQIMMHERRLLFLEEHHKTSGHKSIRKPAR